MKASALIFAACSVALAAAAPVPDQLQEEPQGIKQVVENADYALGTFAPLCSGNKPDCGERRETRVLVHTSNGPCVRVVCGAKSGIEPVSISDEKFDEEEYKHQKEPRDIKQVEVNADRTLGNYPLCSPGNKPDCGERRESRVLVHFSTGPCIKVVCRGKPGIEPVSISDEKFEEGYEDHDPAHDVPPPRSRGGPPPKTKIV